MKTDKQPGLELEVQYAIDDGALPSEEDFSRWVRAALVGANATVGLVVRVVGDSESRDLNHRYRGIDKATNVLSFPFEAPEVASSSHLGDLVICAPVVRREACEQHKAEAQHWAHMVVHGVLHLRGYDHQDDAQALEMETQETTILEKLGIADPYGETDVAV